ncbi:hypothetical protein C2W62_35655 [Candidatus Entotheonella serta]|nr:hypothetical protein C2W62_35655 [Candidatus Entotheonella serta]
MSASPQREALDQILAHVRTVFTQTPFVNTLTDTLTWMPLGQWSNALDQTYQRHHGRMMETAAQYRLYMYIAAGAALALGLLAAVSGSAKPAPEPIALQLPIREPQDDRQITTARGNNLSKLRTRRDRRQRATIGITASASHTRSNVARQKRD